MPCYRDLSREAESRHDLLDGKARVGLEDGEAGVGVRAECVDEAGEDFIVRPGCFEDIDPDRVSAPGGKGMEPEEGDGADEEETAGGEDGKGAEGGD